MSINVGKIRILKELDRHDGGLIFFKFKQNKVEYYGLAVELLDEREGFLAFSLSKNLDELFDKSNYSTNALFNLIKERIDEFYFVSFEYEDPESEIIEYCGPIEKEEVLKLYNIK
jgi:hypothetical protein